MPWRRSVWWLNGVPMLVVLLYRVVKSTTHCGLPLGPPCKFLMCMLSNYLWNKFTSHGLSDCLMKKINTETAMCACAWWSAAADDDDDWRIGSFEPKVSVIQRQLKINPYSLGSTCRLWLHFHFASAWWVLIQQRTIFITEKNVVGRFEMCTVVFDSPSCNNVNLSNPITLCDAFHFHWLWVALSSRCVPSYVRRVMKIKRKYEIQ